VNPKLEVLLSGATSRWDRFWYVVAWLLGSLQSVILRRCVREPVWRSHDGTVRVPRQMTDEHLHNAIRYCERHDGTDSAIYAAMKNEQQTRRYARWLLRQR
jgi:hypothetical protein